MENKEQLTVRQDNGLEARACNDSWIGGPKNDGKTADIKICLAILLLRDTS